MKFLPLGLWKDTWRVYALGLLSAYVGISMVCGGVLWANFSEGGPYLLSIAVAAGTGLGILGGLYAVVAYRVIDADWHPLIRWPLLSLMSGSASAVSLPFLLNGLLTLMEIAAPLMALEQGARQIG